MLPRLYYSVLGYLVYAHFNIFNSSDFPISAYLIAPNVGASEKKVEEMCVKLVAEGKCSRTKIKGKYYYRFTPLSAGWHDK